jgi:transcription factor S
MELNFCDCGGMLMPSEKGSKCRSCGNAYDSKTSGFKVTASSEKKETVVIENNDPDLPATDKTCEKCSNGRAFYWLIQTRSSDEPPTQFFKCTRCRHIWREYK